MTGVKIKIECDDPLLASAVGQSIAEGLERNDYSNIKVKVIMANYKVRYENPPTCFGRISLLGLKDPDAIKETYPTYTTELLPPEIAFGDACVEMVRYNAPGLLQTPILIDTGIEPTDYVPMERKFLKGEE